MTDSFDFDAATTGSYITLELTRSDTGEWRLVGSLTAATIEQQRANVPLVPPHQPPARAEFLDMPYHEFRERALRALDTRCVLPPLRATVADLLSASETTRGTLHDGIVLSAAAATAACVGLLGAGLVCGVLLVRTLRSHRLGRPAKKKLIEVTSVGAPQEATVSVVDPATAGVA